ncbi:hypothetical protein BGZ54_006574 [Gamsiella multidivaricata]|nr:hypothetical protein BGZ54_006574 [Gamsiella multidivaricata]
MTWQHRKGYAKCLGRSHFPLPSRASTILHESDQFVVQFLGADQIAHSVAFSSSVPPPSSVRAALSISESAAVLPSSSSSNPELSQEEGQLRAARSRVPQDKDIQDLVSEASRQTLIESTGKGTSAKTSSTGIGKGSISNESNGASAASPSSGSSEPDPFEVLGYRTDPESNLPVLLDTLGAIRCRTHQVMVVGDHEMWIGHVEKVLHGEIADQHEALLYHDRSYRRVGRRIIK